MEKLLRRQALVSSLTAPIERSQEQIDSATKRAQHDLQETFSWLFEQMKLRQEELQSMVEEVSAYKKQALCQQLEGLKAYKGIG